MLSEIKKKKISKSQMSERMNGCGRALAAGAPQADRGSERLSMPIMVTVECCASVEMPHVDKRVHMSLLKSE